MRTNSGKKSASTSASLRAKEFRRLDSRASYKQVSISKMKTGTKLVFCEIGAFMQRLSSLKVMTNSLSDIMTIDQNELDLIYFGRF